MNSPVVDTKDKDLEWLFAEARKYPLFSPEQERATDADKWAAIEQLQEVLVSSAYGRSFLAALAQNCAKCPPEITRFPQRDQYFLLRRELGAYLEGGASAAAMRRWQRQLSAGAAHRRLNEALQQLMLPGSLVIGMTELLAASEEKLAPGSVAGALDTWQQEWNTGWRASCPAAETGFRSRVRQLVNDYEAARDRLVLHNLRLVYSIAGRFRDRGVSYLDLIQEGTMGLLRAAEKFEYRKGYRFTTYCYNWITQALRRAVADTGPLIRYPGHIHEQLGKLYRESAAMQARSGVLPRDTELARELGLSTDKTRNLLQLRNLGLSLDKPRFDDDEGTTMADALPGGPFQSPIADAELRSLRRCLLTEIKGLDPAEQEVVISRWGLLAGPPLTRAEIADQMAVSREWVRQLERSALAKLGDNPVIRSAHMEHTDLPSQ